jgi:hypothetical protein
MAVIVNKQMSRGGYLHHPTTGREMDRGPE